MTEQQSNEPRRFNGAARRVVPPPYEARNFGGDARRPYVEQPEMNGARQEPCGYYGREPQVARQPVQGNGIGTAGFVLSIVSVIMSVIPFVGTVCWILAVIFSSIGLGRRPRGLAVAGFVISLALPLLCLVLLAGILTIASVDELSDWMWVF